MNKGQGHRSLHGCFAAADLVKVHFLTKWKYINITLVHLRTIRAGTLTSSQILIFGLSLAPELGAWLHNAKTNAEDYFCTAGDLET